MEGVDDELVNAKRIQYTRDLQLIHHAINNLEPAKSRVEKLSEAAVIVQ